MKILITGSTGLIGRMLQPFLEGQGVTVLTYDLKENSCDDLLDFGRLREKAKGIDGIIHLAAVTRPKLAFESPRDCVKINVEGTVNVLEAIRLASPKELPLTEKNQKNPQNIYGLTKLMGEELCQIFSENYGLRTRVLRFTSVYGGLGDSDRVIPRFVIQALKNKPLTVLGTGQEIFDFTHVNDIVLGIWQCIQELIKSSKTYDDFILSYGQPVSLKDLAEIIIKETKSQSKVIFQESRQFSTVKLYADPAKARKILGFDPKININEGIKLVIKELK
jgi:nucleoside-diphosphate-sugar epimerase